MYKLLLCTRYLRTRYLAFVCIISVMLGVSTLIVVNSVMSGFSNKLRDRLHGILADVIVETDRSDGFDDTPEEIIAKIENSPAGKDVAAISPTVETFALIHFKLWNPTTHREMPIIKHVRVIGVNPKRHASVGEFGKYLVNQSESAEPSFAMTDKARARFDTLRRREAIEQEMLQPRTFAPPPSLDPYPIDDAPPLPDIPILKPGQSSDLKDADPVFLPPPIVPETTPLTVPGVILGYSLAHQRYKDPATGEMKDHPLLKLGDMVQIATVSAHDMKPVYSTFVVVDYFKSEMSEYDSSFVYVPLNELQNLRGMDNRVNTLQIRLNDDVRDNTRVVNEDILPALRETLITNDGRVASWQQHQGPLLAAIDIERGILNLLLFMIVGVAGFSVLAIFTMIVSEKYRDIGILKSLGASNRGVMGIFMSYGFLLGLIGCILGTTAGLLITEYINEIEIFLTEQTGQQLFDRSVYYFDRIPTNVELKSIMFINIGALGTAVLFSIIPAWRAARLHPVRALRFE